MVIDRSCDLNKNPSRLWMLNPLSFIDVNSKGQRVICKHWGGKKQGYKTCADTLQKRLLFSQ